MTFIRAFGKIRKPMINFRTVHADDLGHGHSVMIDPSKFINASQKKQVPIESFNPKSEIFHLRRFDIDQKEVDTINGFVDVQDWTKIKSIKSQ